MSQAKSRSKLSYAFTAITVSTVIWGVAPAVIKATLEYLPPFTFLFFRFALVCAILLPYMIIETPRQNPHPHDLPALFLAGLLGQASLVLIFVGLKYTTALEMSVIGIAAPLLSVAAGHYFFKERIPRALKYGLIITSAGLLVLTIGPLLEPHQSDRTALLAVSANIVIALYNVVYTGYILWAKRLRGENSQPLNSVAHFLRIPVPRKRYGSFFMTGLSFYVALAFVTPFFILEQTGHLGGFGVSVLNLPHQAVYGILFMALLSSIVAYGLFEFSLKSLHVTDTAIFSYIAPIITLPAAWLLLAEVPSKEVVLGALVIGLGIAVAEHRKS